MASEEVMLANAGQPFHHHCHSLPAASDARQWLVNFIVPLAQLPIICAGGPVA